MQLFVVARKFLSRTNSTSGFKWLAGRSKNNLISTLPDIIFLHRTKGHLKGKNDQKLLFVIVPEEAATISEPSHTCQTSETGPSS